MAAWRRRHDRTGDGELAELQQEVERLTQENMRLRLEQQRPVALSAVVDLLRDTAERPGEDAAEARDEAHHVAARTEATRRAVVDVLEGLVVAAGQLQRQLTEGVAHTEIDRRVLDRRAGAPEVARRAAGYPLSLLQGIPESRGPLAAEAARS